MRKHVSGKSRNLPRVIAIVFGAMLAAPITYAIPSNKIVLVPPTDLPVLARQSGEAMFLHDTKDGRTLLYVEQRQGAQLAIFDVTDPAHVKGEGSAQLDAVGPFDFVASLGERAELVRFRQGQGEAVLELRKIPTLKKVQGLELQRSTKLTSDGTAKITAPVIDLAMAPSARDYQVLQTGRSQDDRVIEVKQVRQEATRPDTGTTFLLAEKGLYLIRRPALETAEVHLNTGG
ncbi:MAG: hypothetical protein M3N91_02435 [Pseudomonadota bacterium]|nr:hypothetical protein [Pseudomonadota bacterium]